MKLGLLRIKGRKNKAQCGNPSGATEEEWAWWFRIFKSARQSRNGRTTAVELCFAVCAAPINFKAASRACSP